MMFRFFAALLATIFLFAEADQARASLLLNGSFEANSGLPSQWNPVGNMGVVTSQGETDGARALAFSHANTPSNGVISQTFATSPGVTYELTFDFGKFSVNQPTEIAKLNVDVFDSTTLPGFGGPVVLSVVVMDNTPGPGNSVADASVYDPYAFTFLAAGTSATLRFADASDPQSSGGGFDAMLDNVTLDAIPEPTTLWLALLGTMSVCNFRRFG